MSITERLHEMRNYGGKALTKGLPDDVILGFAARFKTLDDTMDLPIEVSMRLLPEAIPCD